MRRLLSLLRFSSRASAGVPISDPVAEVRVLKTWTRLGVYSVLIATRPIDLYVMGLTLPQAGWVLLASFTVATLAIEGIFRQSLKLRKRSAYPALVLAEAGASVSLGDAAHTCLTALQRLLGLRAVAIIDSMDDLKPLALLGSDERACEDLVGSLTPVLRKCFDSQQAAVMPPPAGLDASSREVIVLIPVVAFGRGIGIVLAIGDRRSVDLKDIELLQGIGSAIGLTLENQRQKEEIRDKEERLRAVVTAAPVVLLSTDAKGVFTLFEGKALDRLDISSADVLGRSVLDVFKDIPSVVQDFRRALAGEVMKTVAELGPITFEAELCPIRDAAGCVTSVIGVATDITERKQAEDTIRHMAYHDSLTGLPNRELFERTLTQSLSEAQRHGSLLAVLFVDLDGFKDVNDTVGHAEGDRLLKEVADQLTALVRTGDFVARIGGDEFLVLLPQIRGPHEAVAVSQRILSGLQVDWLPGGGQRLRLSASIGVAVYPDDGRDGDALMRAADRAMYRAKSCGKDRYALVTS